MPLYSPMLQRAAVYHRTHAGHRRSAVETAIAVIRGTAAQEEDEVAGTAYGVGEWVIESLLQGAYVREFHHWETDTKRYCDDQLGWNRLSPFRWRDRKQGDLSQVDKVVLALGKLSVTLPAEIFAQISEVRARVNVLKHDDGEASVTEAEYNAALGAIEAFWEALAGQERFRPHLHPDHITHGYIGGSPV